MIKNPTFRRNPVPVRAPLQSELAGRRRRPDHAKAGCFQGCRQLLAARRDQGGRAARHTRRGARQHGSYFVERHRFGQGWEHGHGAKLADVLEHIKNATLIPGVLANIVLPRLTILGYFSLAPSPMALLLGMAAEGGPKAAVHPSQAGGTA